MIGAYGVRSAVLSLGSAAAAAAAAAAAVVMVVTPGATSSDPLRTHQGMASLVSL